MFDFTPVGLGLAAAGHRVPGLRLPAPARTGRARRRSTRRSTSRTTRPRRACPRARPFVGKTVADLRSSREGDVAVDRRSCATTTAAPGRCPDAVLRAGRPPAARRRPPKALRARRGPAGAEARRRRPRRRGKDSATDEIGVHRGGDRRRRPSLIGKPPSGCALHERYGVNLLAVSRSGERITERLRDIRLCAPATSSCCRAAAAPAATRCKRARLPAARRARHPARQRRAAGSIPIVDPRRGDGARPRSASLPVAIAFFGAAVLLVLFGVAAAARGLRHHRMADPGHARRADPGQRRPPHAPAATDLIASWLVARRGSRCRRRRAWRSIMVAAMAVTPFLNNAATVLVMAPIAASFAAAARLSRPMRS